MDGLRLPGKLVDATATADSSCLSWLPTGSLTASPIRARTASTWLPSKNAAANPAANVPLVNVIRCPSTNDNAAASSSVTAGAANGNRRRANSGSIMSQSAGTASQVDKLGPPT